MLGFGKCILISNFKLLLSDINECSLGSDGCSHTCNNTDGGYECDCPDGYVLYQHQGFNEYDVPQGVGETGLQPGDTYHINHTCVCE